jgi:hypothetical protein
MDPFYLRKRFSPQRKAAAFPKQMRWPNGAECLVAERSSRAGS